MADNTDYENMSVFEQIKTGLDQAIAHGRGKLSLKATTRNLHRRPRIPTSILPGESGTRRKPHSGGVEGNHET
jgi:hypothetical protein